MTLAGDGSGVPALGSKNGPGVSKWVVVESERPSRRGLGRHDDAREEGARFLSSNDDHHTHITQPAMDEDDDICQHLPRHAQLLFESPSPTDTRALHSCASVANANSPDPRPTTRPAPGPRRRRRRALPRRTSLRHGRRPRRRRTRRREEVPGAD